MPMPTTTHLSKKALILPANLPPITPPASAQTAITSTLR